MKKTLLYLFALLLITFSSQAQTTLWSESFDSTAAANYTVTQGGEGLKINTTYNTTSDYFFRTSGGYFYMGSGVAQNYSGNVGNFFAAQDIDGGTWSGAASPSQLTWTGINISGYSNLSFEGLFGSINDGKIDASDSVLVEYQINGAGWLALLALRNDGTTYNTGFLQDANMDGIGEINNLDSAMMMLSASIPGAGSSLDLRITVAVDAGGEDVAFDEFKIKGSMATSYQPSILSFTPADASTGVSITTDLVMTLDTAVQAGSGMIHIYNNTNNSTTDIAANSADVSFSGHMVTLSNLLLDYASDYTILVDSSALALSTGEMTSGIYDSTRWNFTTAAKIDTVDPGNGYASSFENCALDWKKISTNGAKEWKCSYYGRTDSSAMYMNGYASGSAQANEDYLISPPVKNSAAYTEIKYWQKRRFTGDNTIRLAWSDDYDGGSNPENFTWTDLMTDNGSIDTNWTDQAYSTPQSSGSYGYFAFIYESDTTNSVFEWTVDDIVIWNPESIRSFYKQLNASLRTNPSQNGIAIVDLVLESAGDLNIAIYNTLGQKMLEKNEYTAAQESLSIDVSELPDGMYLLHLQIDEGAATLKLNITN